LDRFHYVRFPPPKENLKMFGGHMSIEEYRLGFMEIHDIDWVTRCFVSTNQYEGQLSIFTRLREYVYDFLPPSSSDQYEQGSINEVKEESEQEPEIMMDGIDESFFH
jgi:hypothetical protein